MSYELINMALINGAVLYPNVSGGKDGQAMVKVMLNRSLPMAGLIHADLGRTEWKESMGMCEKLAKEAGVPLIIVKRSDGRDMIDHWKHRLNQMKPTAYQASDIRTRQEITLNPIPFWSSSKSRYCTSDMKRDPIDTFYRNSGYNFIVSCEGIRAQESTKRAAKEPLTIRKRITHPYYNKMSVKTAIKKYNPKYRLALTWYPVFNYSLEEVWQTYGVDSFHLDAASNQYKLEGKVPKWWPFHPAYVYGNKRVSCVFCIMGCAGDLKNGAEHRPELLEIMIQMEEEGRATFKNNFSLKELL